MKLITTHCFDIHYFEIHDINKYEKNGCILKRNLYFFFLFREAKDGKSSSSAGAG